MEPLKGDRQDGRNEWRLALSARHSNRRPPPIAQAVMPAAECWMPQIATAVRYKRNFFQDSFIFQGLMAGHMPPLPKGEGEKSSGFSSRQCKSPATGSVANPVGFSSGRGVSQCPFKR